MPPSDKTMPSVSVFNGPTTLSPSPYAAPTADRTVEVTTPGWLNPAASPLSEVVSLIGERRPDLVEILLNLDRTYRQQAETALRAQVTEQQRQLDRLLARVETLMKSARDVADDAVQSGLDKQRLAIDALLGRIDKQLADTNTTSMQAEKLTSEVRRIGEPVREDAHAVARDQKALVDRIAGERDRLSEELAAARAQLTAERERAAQTRAEDQRAFTEQRRGQEGQLAEAAAALKRQEGRARELEAQVNEALASRDRIALRIREVEAKLDEGVIALREQLETARTREAQARVKVEATQKELEALRLLSPRIGRP